MKKIQYDTFNLPVTSDGKVDYYYMKTYISAVQKIVIADVVKYADEQIRLTNHIIQSR